MEQRPLWLLKVIDHPGTGGQVTEPPEIPGDQHAEYAQAVEQREEINHPQQVTHHGAGERDGRAIVIEHSEIECLFTRGRSLAKNLKENRIEPFQKEERSEERRVGKECRSRWSP